MNTNRFCRTTVVAVAFLFISVWSGLTAPPARAAAPTAGDLVKLADSSAVYYYGADAKRHAFPNSATYFTWYADFKSVKTLTAAEMAALPLGSNITYRSGTRLIKITSDPKVYAVEPGGLLRPLASETVAVQLYGPDWAKRVDDVSDAFFVNYNIGDALAVAIFPNGSVVKRISDGAYFLIQNGLKRRLSSDAVLTALRIQTKDILTATSLDGYVDGEQVTGAEPAILDASGSNQLPTAAATPTFSVATPSTTYIPVSGDDTLLEFSLSSAKAVTVRRLSLRIEATTGSTPTNGNIDDDLGGLVYGNNAQANLRLIRIVDMNGRDLTTAHVPNLDVSQDQAQTFVFDNLTLFVEANSKQSWRLKAQLNPLLPAGEGYRVVLVTSGTTVTDNSTGQSVSFLPTTDLAGTALTTLNDALEVTYGGPESKIYVRGAKDVAIGGVNVKATTYAPNVIRSVKFQGYVDSEQVGDFVAGGDADNGREVRARDIVSQVSLYDNKGTKVAGPVPVDFDGRAVFSDLSFAIPAGQSEHTHLAWRPESTIDVGSMPDLLGFDIEDAANDMVVTDVSGNPVVARGKHPNGGYRQSSYVTVRDHGQVKIYWDGSGGNVMAGDEVNLGQLSFDPDYDSYRLRTVSFRQVGTPAKSLTDARLEYTTADKKTLSVTSSFIGGNVTFTGLAANFPRDQVTGVRLYGHTLPRDAGALYGEKIAIIFGNADALEFVSNSDGQVFSAEDLGNGDFKLDHNNASSAQVRWSAATVAKAASNPTVDYHDVDADVLHFTITADPHGAIRLSKLTFKVTPGDAGVIAGPHNDSLEQWSFVNGDMQNDVGVAKLIRWYSNDNKETLGENGSATMQYSVVRRGGIVTNPAAQNIESTPTDYALITYQFREGSEVFIPAGATHEFRFSANASFFPEDKIYSLQAEVESGSDFVWTDVVSGQYTPLTGGDASGLPVSNKVDVRP